MTSFDPNTDRKRCEAYFSRHLGGSVRLISARQLPQSTRVPPWRLTMEQEGTRASYVLRLEVDHDGHEYHILRAMEQIPIPTPRAYGWDPTGEALGVPCFFCDFIEGISLLKYMLANEPWADELYLETVSNLQAITREQLGEIAGLPEKSRSAEGELERANTYFREHPNPLAESIYETLKAAMPPFPKLRFSNGDLYPDNLLVVDRRLVGIIDWEYAGFTDPIYEFLAAAFYHPELRGRGTEERYCERMGFDAAGLPWYRGLEYFTTWSWAARTGKSFSIYNAKNLQEYMRTWFDEFRQLL